MKIASIDIGTNTVLLLIAEIDAKGTITTLLDVLRLPRLGEGVDSDLNISQESTQRVEAVLMEYASLIKQRQIDHVVACGTSALRDASNSDEFIERMNKTTGIRIEILSGADEALWTFKGAISGMAGASESYAVLDIGGGSTEISFSDEAVPYHPAVAMHRHSFQLGSVRITERFFKKQPPFVFDLYYAKKNIAAEFSAFSSWNIANRSLVGVAGTVTTLACLEMGLMDFDREKVSGYILSLKTIQKWLSTLSALAPNDIRQLSNTTYGREDILTAGTLILSEFMSFFGFQNIIVSERGVRYGLVLREWEKTMKK